MLSLEEAISQRRSIRKFKPDPLNREIIDRLLESARLAPSGSNRQPWRFLVTTDPKEKKRLKEICLGQAFIEEAPVVFVCCADLTAYSAASRKARLQEYVGAGVLETLSGRFSDPSYRERAIAEPEPSEVLRSAMANVYIAIEHMVLTATSMGLGSCWVGALGDEGEITGLFGLPDHIVPVIVLPVGYSDRVPPQRPRISMSEILLRPLE